MATFAQSTEQNWNPWTSSAEDSPARISARQESRPVSRELAAACGLSTPVWFGNFDLDTCSLRTSQGSLFQTQCDELSENWPDSGMWDATAVYELQSSEPVTCESACSSWPTATANDAQQRQISVLWPTARAEDSESCGNHPGATDSLTGATRNWATPKALTGGPNSNREAWRERTGKTGGADLQEQIGHWQTPATDSFRSRGGDRKDEMGLDQDARSWNQWRTPTHCSENSLRGSGQDPAIRAAQGHAINLQDQTLVWNSLPAPATHDGPPSSESGQTSRRRLNPRFVEWLMGFPVSWTEL